MKRVYAVVPLALICMRADPVTGQTIPIRTVPVASGDQFLMLPSRTMGMGGVHLALDDSLGDVWSNPAKGVLVGESAFFGSPTYYSISAQGGAGRTFPVAGIFAGSEWFGGGALALQQIENEETDRGFFVTRPTVDVCCFRCCGPTGGTLSERLGRNVYANGFLGRRIGPEWAIGVAGFGARLGMMDGVDLLYANAERIEQSGSVSDVRVGLYRSGSRDRLSLVLLHNRVSMTHEVTTVNWIWDPVGWGGRSQRLVEVNEDHTRTFGGHVEWDRSLTAPGWRVGASATINYKDHPKIPNYSIQNIPRDPGTTWAYEGAVGFARTDERTRFALDFALQPIWSETWQEADAAAVEASGQRLRVGDRSIDNDFFFTNVVVRSGLSYEVRGADLQVGLQIRSYAYQLEQVDHVRSTYREQNESWIEWSPTFGVRFSFEALDVQYAGRITTGTGRPGSIPDRAFAAPEALLGDADFILAPEGPLTLQDAKVTTHQLSVRIPFR